MVKSQGGTAHALALKREGQRWAFGAGKQAITYVSQLDEDYYLEHGLSFYRRPGKPALTPGHRDEGGVRYRTFAPDAAILRCFGCHSTGSLKLTAARAIEPAETGVRCESCHGPGAEHAAKPSLNNIRRPGAMSGHEINELCGTCHRMPPAAGSATNWRNPWNVRHQPVYLAQSRCFIASAGKLSCLTCHSAHSDEREPKCASCHTAVKHVTQIAGKSCVECHMPAVEPAPYLRFANHWIGIYNLAADRLRPLQQRPRLSRPAALLKQ